MTESSGESGFRRRPWRSLLRVTVGAGVVAVLLARTDLAKLGHVVRSVRPVFLVAAFAMVMLGVFVSAIRWRAFLRALGFGQSLGELTRLYFVGGFFNAFLPTGIGGDAYKAIRLRGRPGPLSASLASTVLDRLAGITALGVIGLVAVTVAAASGDHKAVVGVTALLCAAILAGAALLVGAPGIIARVLAIAPAASLRTAGTNAVEAIARAGREPGAVVVGLVTGVAFQGLVLAFHALLAAALHVHIGVTALVCTVVVVTFASLVPFTFNGLGFREASYIWALGAYGIRASEALAFALLVLALLLAGSAVGGLLYVTGRR